MGPPVRARSERMRQFLFYCGARLLLPLLLLFAYGVHVRAHVTMCVAHARACADTTRPQRESEMHGGDYHFVTSREEMERHSEPHVHRGGPVPGQPVRHQRPVRQRYSV